MPVDFVHLRVHTEFSLVDSLVKVKPLVSTVAKQGMPAVAVTDQSNLFALVKFYNSAQNAGIKPIIGADVWVANADEPDLPFRLTLLARTDQGYANLRRLLSQGYQQGQHFGKAILQHDWLEAASEGLIALSGASEGDVGRALLADKPEVAEACLLRWMGLFRNGFYLELQRTGKADDETCLHASVALAEAHNCPVVATNPVHFLTPDDFDAHEARVCINEGRVLDDPRRPRRFTEQQYLRSAAEMAALFEDIPEALANTVEIAKRCNVTVELGKYYLPNYPIPQGMTLDEFFIRESEKGLEERLTILLDADAEDYQARRQQYFNRLKFELDIIIQMGFPGYFLIVMDFIRWAKNNGVPVGPGRGSGAGSLVAYALQITDLDPLAYDLLFERFLNPERVSMPDFDVDFCMDGRDDVINYVAETYGREAVSQIITFGTMAAKAVVRDVARVQGKPYGLADRLSKMIPFEVGMTLNKALEQEAELKQFVETDEEAGEIMDMAFKLEGITRNVGKHAGGVVIAPTRLTDFSPLYCDENGEGLVTQFDKDDVEQAGLVKFDFLGLRTLTIVDWAVEMVNRQRARSGEAPLDINDIPLVDAPTFELLQRADTTAVFQLESRGMKELIKKLKPDCFEDIIALVALFRPGPLQSGMVDDFIDRKHGRAEVSYPHPDYQHPELEPVLKPTYGIILYQEQVMQIAQVLANYTLGGADLLRRAMGKKKPEVMAEQRKIFMDGATGRGIEAELAGHIFDLMEKFAGYGFNKSHSAAYALVSFQTAWLKAHYPAPFMAAVLTADMQNTDKIVTLVEACRDMKLDIVLPDVNVSEYTFTVDDDNRIVYGLGAIKGLGEGPINNIIEARQQGPFTDMFDFCDRVDGRKVNKRALEALIKSGALDNIGPSRARLTASIPEAIQRADQNAKNADIGMADLFGELASTDSADDPYAATAQMKEWSQKERLNYEKETLGLYVTGHPFDQYEREVRAFAPVPVSELREARKKNQVVAGLVVALRIVKTKRGGQLAILTLDDRSGRIEAVVGQELFEQGKEHVRKDAILVLEGEVTHDDFSGGLKVSARKLAPIAQARAQYARSLTIQVGHAGFEPRFAHQLSQALNPFRQQQACPVTIDYRNADAFSRIQLAEEWRVLPDDTLLDSLRQLVGDNQVELEYH